MQVELEAASSLTEMTIVKTCPNEPSLLKIHNTCPERHGHIMCSGDVAVNSQGTDVDTGSQGEGGNLCSNIGTTYVKRGDQRTESSSEENGVYVSRL